MHGVRSGKSMHRMKERRFVTCVRTGPKATSTVLLVFHAPKERPPGVLLGRRLARRALAAHTPTRRTPPPASRANPVDTRPRFDRPRARFATWASLPRQTHRSRVHHAIPASTQIATDRPRAFRASRVPLRTRSDNPRAPLFSPATTPQLAIVRVPPTRTRRRGRKLVWRVRRESTPPKRPPSVRTAPSCTSSPPTARRPWSV